MYLYRSLNFDSLDLSISVECLRMFCIIVLVLLLYIYHFTNCIHYWYHRQSCKIPRHLAEPLDLDNVYFIFFAVWVGLLASVFAWTFAKWKRFRYLYSKKHRWLPLIIVSFCYSCTRIHKHRKHTYIPNYLTSLHINLLAIPCEMESLIPCFFSLFAILESECRLLILCLPFFFYFSIEFSYSFWFSNKF